MLQNSQGATCGKNGSPADDNSGGNVYVRRYRLRRRSYAPRTQRCPVQHSAAQGILHQYADATVNVLCYFLALMTACAPASRASGTRNGEQET